MNARLKTLSWDIEVSPISAHVWGLWQQNVGLNQIRDPGHMLGFAAAWDHKPVKSWFEWDDCGHLGMLETARDLLDEADYVVSYNGTRFDSKWLNTELTRHGLRLPSPYREIDLCRIAKARLYLPSYKLAWVSKHFGVGEKMSTGGHDLWVECLEGNAKSRKRMAAYCRQDVRLLPDLLDKMRELLPANVNFALNNGSDQPACTKCGSFEVQSRGYAISATGRYQRYQCQSCGGWSRSTRRADGALTTGVTR